MILRFKSVAFYFLCIIFIISQIIPQASKKALVKALDNFRNTV